MRPRLPSAVFINLRGRHGVVGPFATHTFVIARRGIFHRRYYLSGLSADRIAGHRRPCRDGHLLMILICRHRLRLLFQHRPRLRHPRPLLPLLLLPPLPPLPLPAGLKAQRVRPRPRQEGRPLEEVHHVESRPEPEPETRDGWVWQTGRG